MASEALRIQELKKFFPPALSGWKALLHPMTRSTVPALRGVSFEVAAGEVVGLIGQNGAGKSTLLRVLTTLLLPTSGQAWICGADVVREPERARRQLGFHSGADKSFYARLSGRENLLFFAALNNLTGQEASQRIAALNDLLDLGASMDMQVRTFSTGMVHRLGLARAMLHRPPVLVLDEPTRSLDPIAAGEFRRFLARDVVGAYGTTLLFASHSLAEVEQMCNRIALLHGGCLLAFDTPARLKATAGKPTLEQAVETLVRGAQSPS